MESVSSTFISVRVVSCFVKYVAYLPCLLRIACIRKIVAQVVKYSETAHDNLCHEILRPRHDRFTTEQDTHIIEL